MAGLLRYSIEQVLYSTSPTAKKSPTHADEAQGVCKTVGKLLQRFEKHSQGEELEVTLISVVEDEKAEIHLEQRGDDSSTSGNYVVDTCILSGYDSFRNRCETETGRTSTPVTPRRFADQPVNQRRIFETPAQPKKEVLPKSTKTPILGSKTSTGSESTVTSNRSQPVPSAQKPRPSSINSNSSGESGSSSETDTPFSQSARKEVLATSAKFAKWESQKLRELASGAAHYRLNTLLTTRLSERTPEVEAVIETYTQCIITTGNVALESLCLALIELNESVDDKELTEHEKYAAYKFAKKLKQSQS